MSLESAGFKHRVRPVMPSSTSSSACASGAPGGAGGGPQASAVFARRGMPAVGRESHDRCLEELEKERYHRVTTYSATTSSNIIIRSRSTVNKRIIISTNPSGTMRLHFLC